MLCQTFLLLLLATCSYRVTADNVFDRTHSYHEESATTTTTIGGNKTRSLEEESSALDEQVVEFYAFSDAPFGSRERAHFPLQLQTLESRPDFMVHLGNIRERQQECARDDVAGTSHLDEVSTSLLQYSKIPTFVVPGDSDWYNCLDQEGAFDEWANHFLYFEDQWNHSFDVSHQTNRQENFFFVHKGVLFVSFHVLSSSVKDWAVWNALVKDNVSWLESVLVSNAFSDDVGAIVLLAHAQPHTRRYRDFYESLRSVTLNIDKPMLYLHGDDRLFAVDTDFLPGVDRMMRVSVARGGDEDPMQVTVNPFGEIPFTFKRRALQE